MAERDIPFYIKPTKAEDITDSVNPIHPDTVEETNRKFVSMTIEEITYTLQEHTKEELIAVIGFSQLIHLPWDFLEMNAPREENYTAATLQECLERICHDLQTYGMFLEQVQKNEQEENIYSNYIDIHIEKYKVILAKIFVLMNVQAFAPLRDAASLRKKMPQNLKNISVDKRRVRDCQILTQYIDMLECIKKVFNSFK